MAMATNVAAMKMIAGITHQFKLLIVLFLSGFCLVPKLLGFLLAGWLAMCYFDNVSRRQKYHGRPPVSLVLPLLTLLVMDEAFVMESPVWVPDGDVPLVADE